MDANAQGIGINKRELSALLAFTSKDSEDRNKFGVLFRVDGDRVFARSTDGRKSVEADGISDGAHHNGEWLVDRAFLVKAGKIVTGSNVLRLPFEGASLHRAVTEGEEYSRDEPDAAIAQHSFPDLTKALKTPSGRNLTAHVSVGDRDTLVALALVAKAADRSLTLRVPATADVPSIWEAQNDDTETKWTVSLAPYSMPAKKSGKGKGRGKGKDDRQQELPGAEAAE